MRRIAFLAFVWTLLLWAAANAEEILLSERSPSATIMSIEGINTSRSSLTARITEVGARELCSWDPHGLTRAKGGDLTFQQCVSTVVAEHSGSLSAAADCPQGLLKDTYGRRLRRGDKIEFGYDWIDLATGESIGQCTQCNNDAADSQFAALCPFS